MFWTINGLTPNIDRHSTIQTRADELWEQMPAEFRLENTLNERGRNAFERDFMLSSRLNYLHVVFLIRFVQLKGLGEPDDSIVYVAEEMLRLVTEATLQRDRLANSGVGFVWKVRDRRRALIHANRQRLYITVCQLRALCCLRC